MTPLHASLEHITKPASSVPRSESLADRAVPGTVSAGAQDQPVPDIACMHRQSILVMWPLTVIA